MKLTLLAAVLGAVICTGCLSQEAIQRARAEYQATIPRCLDAEECELMWAAARRWIQNNAGLRIETYSDNYIQTHKSGDYANTLLGVEAWKEPLGGGMYEIRNRMWINNAFSQTEIPDRMIQFNRYVGAAASRAAAAR